MKVETKLLVSPKDVKPTFPDWKIDGVFNPAAIRMPDKKIMIYARIAESSTHKHRGGLSCPVIVSPTEYKVKYEEIKEERIIRKRGRSVIFLREGLCRLPNISHFRKIILSEDGFNVEKIDDKPTFIGNSEEGQFGVEDARIVKIDKMYVMTYVTVSEKEGVCTSLAISSDLKKWKRKGIIFRQQNKDVIIFPEKVRGKYIAFHRPEGTFAFSTPSVWISKSPDLIHWGEEKSVIHPREGAWDGLKVGTGTPPIKIKEGWLLIYHGFKGRGKRNVYHAGAILLDSKNPEKIIARSPSNKPLFSPEMNYEKKGFVNNVVFPTGAVLDKNKKDLLIYSGGADKVITVKRIAIEDILKNMKHGIY